MQGSSPSTPSMIGPKQSTLTVGGASFHGFRAGMWIQIDDGWRPTFKLFGHEFLLQLPFKICRSRFVPWYKWEIAWRPYLEVRRIHKDRGVFQIESVKDNTTITLSE